MKRFVLPLLTVLVLALAASPAFAASSRTTDRSPGAAVATAMSTVTGIAISPLLGTGAYGAYQYAKAPDEKARAALPWYAQVNFWLPALLLVALVAAKDSLGAVIPPGLKKPLDVLEVMENKASGLVAAGAVVPFTMNSVSKFIAAHAGPAIHHISASSGLAMLHFGTIDFSWALDILTVPFGIAMFAIVWMASHAINVLILLSPWGAIDAALKAMRTGLLGLLTLTATINPWVGALLSVVVIVVAYLVAGWAFRLTTCGSVFCWDFFTLRRSRFTPAANDNLMFAGGNLPGVPVRTYGRLVKRADGGDEFVYRPWLLLAAKTAPVPVGPAQLAVGKGLFFSTITAENAGTLFLLPPRYRGHEQAVVQAYAMGGGVRDAGLRKAWSLLKELFGGSAAKTQVV